MGPSARRQGAIWTQVRADGCSLEVVATSGMSPLTLTAAESGPGSTSLEAQAKRKWLSDGVRAGILANGHELRLEICDDDCHWHTVALNTADSDFVALPLDANRTLASLCSPESVRQLGDFARALSARRRSDLEGLRSAIHAALGGLLNALLRDPRNAEAISARANPDEPSNLWQSGLFLTFAVLLVAQAELGARCQPSDGVLTSATWRESHSPTHALLPLLASRPPQTGEPSQAFETRLRGMLVEVLDAFCSSSTSAQPRHPGGVAALLDLAWPELACRQFAELLLLESSVRDARKSAPAPPMRQLVAVPTQDLVNLLESFLDYTPAIAQQPMARFRRGQREVVVPSNQPTSGASSRPVEAIAPGQFYVVATKGRKSAGAFYTPKALVETITRQALEQRLADIPVDDWASVLRWSVLDPAMGTGTFLLETLTHLGRALFERLVNTFEDSSQFETARRDEADNDSSVIPEALATSVRAWHARRRASPSISLSESHPVDVLMECIVACAERCLYGVDQNVVSTHIARLAIWTRCGCSRRVARAMSQHLLTGNALSAPRLKDLFSSPQAKQPLSAPLRAELSRCCERYFSRKSTRGARGTTGDLTCDCSTDLPLRRYLSIWSSAVVAPRQSEESVETALRAALFPPSRSAPDKRGSAPPRLASADGLCFELEFPERFQFSEERTQGGFELVLGNPPWDSVKHSTRELLSRHALQTCTLTTKTERDALATRLRSEGTLANALEQQVAEFERLKQVHDRLYDHQKLIVDGDLAGRQLDLFRLFLERSWGLLSDGGVLAMVVPSSFHTAAGATGVRRLIFGHSKHASYAVFRNTRRWFDVAPGLEFGLLVAQRGHLDQARLAFQFGLEGPEPLLSGGSQWLQLPLSHFLEDNPYASIAAVSSSDELDLLTRLRASTVRLLDFARTSGIDLRSTPTSVHRTHEAKNFLPAPTDIDLRRSIPSRDQLVRVGALLHEGATFNRYDDTWGTPPAFLFSSRRLLEVPRWRQSVGFYRLAVRAIVGASPHKCIAALIAPGTLVANSALVEASPQARPNWQALVTLSVLNSSTASFLLSTIADLNVNLFALRRLPWPKFLPCRFLAHTALRLLANHPGHVALWREQLGPSVSPSLPAISHPDGRASLFAAIDATVARAYGLSRSEYRLILSRFRDGAFSGAEAAFDELESEGETAFFLRRDPFADRELVQTLPSSLFGL